MKNKKTQLNKIISLIGVLFLLGAPIAHAYFNDTETSENNIFEVGVLNFSLNATGNFLPNLTETLLTSTQTINLSKDGTLPFKYKVKVENYTGGLCSNLKLKDNLTDTYQTLSSFVSNETSFSAKENFIFTANSSSNNPSLQGEICNFDLVFEGWQENLADDTQGFTDTETINSTVKMDYWEPGVVMNEFLPNPLGDDNQSEILGEWVEFYNNGSSPIDLTDWYIEDISDNGNRQTISSANTYGGQTIIGAKDSGSEWLVLFVGGAKLNNTGDTITFYNPNGVQVDTYTYITPVHNVNNTLGGTNDMALYLPFDNDYEDLSGNDNDGTNSGTVFVTGKINDGLSFDGINDYVEVPDSDSLDITDEITLEAWVYPTAWDNTHENNILTKGGENSGLGAWSLHYKTESNGFRFELVDDETPYPLFESVPSKGLNQWYHVVGTYDGSAMKLYINGVISNSTTTYSGLINTNDDSLMIGKKFWYGSDYSYRDGSIDEVKIYNRALDADEVLAHYNAVGASLGEVPENKSYARIPDGTGDWVDPVPTMGRPNILTEEDVNLLLEQGVDVPESVMPFVVEESTGNENEIVEEKEDTEQENDDEINSSSLTQDEPEKFIENAVSTPPIDPSVTDIEEEEEEGTSEDNFQFSISNSQSILNDPISNEEVETEEEGENLEFPILNLESNPNDEISNEDEEEGDMEHETYNMEQEEEEVTPEQSSVQGTVCNLELETCDEEPKEEKVTEELEESTEEDTVTVEESELEEEPIKELLEEETEPAILTDPVEEPAEEEVAPSEEVIEEVVPINVPKQEVVIEEIDETND